MLLNDKFGFEYRCDFNFEGCNTLVLSGGALKCIYFLGALSRIGPLKFRNFAATSCGTIISTLLAAGYTPVEIFKELLSRNDENQKTSELLKDAVEGIEYLLTKKGFCSNITFSEFEQQTQKRLAFVATNVSKLKEEIFTSDTHPNIPIISAIKLSCSLPFIFPISKYNNDIYADGIFFDNFPLKLCRLFNNRHKILALTTNNSYFDKSVRHFYTKTKFYKIIYLPDKINKYFNISKSDKVLMFVTGYNYIDKNIKFCKENKKRHRTKSV